MDEKEVAEYTGLSVTVLRRGRMGIALGPTPPYCKIGRRVVYLRDDVDRWLESLRVNHEKGT